MYLYEGIELAVSAGIYFSVVSLEQDKIVSGVWPTITFSIRHYTRTGKLLTLLFSLVYSSSTPPVAMKLFVLQGVVGLFRN